MREFGLGDFDGDRLRAAGEWIVCFAADWCPFCRRFLPEFEAAEASAPIPFARVDLTDEENPLWERFAIEVVPSLLRFQDGRVVDRRDAPRGIGLQRQAIDDLLDRRAHG